MSDSLGMVVEVYESDELVKRISDFFESCGTLTRSEYEAMIIDMRTYAHEPAPWD